MKKLIVLIALLFSNVVFGLANIPASISGYLDNSGDQVENGYVGFYSSASVSTFKDVYSDYNGLNIVSQSGYGIQLNSSGLPTSGGLPVALFGDGTYWVVLRDSDGVIINTYESINYTEPASTSDIPWINVGNVYGTEDSDIQLALSEHTDTSNEVTFLFDTDFTVSSSQTVPSHIRLRFVNGATLTVEFGNTFTINSQDVVFENRSYISNSGTVAFTNPTIYASDDFNIFQGTGTWSGYVANRVVYPEWFGSSGDGTGDDSGSWINAIGILPKGVLKLGNKTYNLQNTVTISSKDIQIIGNGGSNTIIDIDHTGDGIVWKGTRITYQFKSQLGISNLMMQGEPDDRDLIPTGSALLRFEYVGLNPPIRDITFNQAGHTGIYLKSAQDMLFENLYFRRMGSTANAQIVMGDYDEGQGDTAINNVNDIEFISCTWEFEYGQPLKSFGRSNNSNSFIGCKFEADDSKTIYTEQPFFSISGANNARWQWVDSRFTFYDVLLEADDTDTISIEGQVYNRADPTNALVLTDCKNINIDLTGQLIGKNKFDNNTYPISNEIMIDYDDEPSDQFSILDTWNEYESWRLNNVRYGSYVTVNYEADANKYEQVLECDDQDFKILVLQPIVSSRNAERLPNGINVHTRALSDASGSYEFRIVNATEGIDQILEIKTITSSYDWYTVSIPAEYIKPDSFFRINTTGSHSGKNLKIADMFYENKYYADLEGNFSIQPLPTRFSFVTGNIVFEDVPDATNDLAAICINSGAGYSTTRNNTTAYGSRVWAEWPTGTDGIWEVTTAGTTAGSAPSVVGKVVGDTVVDGTVTWTKRDENAAVFRAW